MSIDAPCEHDTGPPFPRAGRLDHPAAALARSCTFAPRSDYHPPMPVDLLVVLVIVLIVVLVWRGPKTLPKLGEAFGRGVKEARKEAGELRSDVQRLHGGDDETPTAPGSPTQSS
jgi:Sec-independent protein translocase protein TatA